MKLMKGKAFREQSLRGKIAVSVLLKFLSVKMKDATPLTPPSA